jgi:hypothetical protein
LSHHTPRLFAFIDCGSAEHASLSARSCAASIDLYSRPQQRLENESRLQITLNSVSFGSIDASQLITSISE